MILLDKGRYNQKYRFFVDEVEIAEESTLHSKTDYVLRAMLNKHRLQNCFYIFYSINCITLKIAPLYKDCIIWMPCIKASLAIGPLA